MHLQTTLTHLALLLFTTASPTLPRSAAYTCDVSPTHPASRLGASKCVEALQQAANEAGGPTGGTFAVQVGGEPSRISEYRWTTDKGNELWSFVEVKFLGEPDAARTQGTGAEATVEVPRREVAGMLMGLIEGCSDRTCIDLDCPVSGAVKILDGTVEVRLLGA